MTNEVSKDYVNFYLNTASYVVALDCLEISHPGFSKTFYIVRNATEGITVRHENGDEVEYLYWPCTIKKLGQTSSLTSGISVDLGDLSEILPAEIKSALLIDDGTIKPTVIYRIYRTDDLSKPMDGPFLLEIETFTSNREGCNFEAKAPSLNTNVTGEIYDFDRFPSLRSFIY